MYEPFHEVVANVSKTVLEYEKKLDRPVIGVMPAYFPMELIWAAGGFPVQLWGNNLALENDVQRYVHSLPLCKEGRYHWLEMRPRLRRYHVP